MEMKKVFMVAYQFPPMGGAGVQRSSKFAKYLSQFGWKPVVLTVEAHGLKDDSLADELSGVEVIRTKPYNLSVLPKPLNLVGKFLSRKVFSPDGEWLWYWMNRKKVIQMVEKLQPDVIYTTSYPYSDHLMGYDLKKAFPHIPWVVDFRDEWMNNPYIWDMNYPQWRMKREAKMEKRVIESCNHFITNTPYMLKSFMEDYDLENRSTVIPNGFDQSDFENISIIERGTHKLVMTYAGAMYGRRKPDSFLMALKKAIDSGAVDAKNLQVNFVGSFTQEHKDQVTKILGNSEIVTFVPYLPHKKSIEFLMNSDVLLLIMDSGKGAEKFYSGKIFEYIKTGKTILGLVPVPGAAAEVIIDTKTGIAVDNTNMELMTQAIIDLYMKWQNGELRVEPNQTAINQYNRVVLTKELSLILNRCITEGVKK